jgi:hypothetical protein
MVIDIAHSMFKNSVVIIYCIEMRKDKIRVVLMVMVIVIEMRK